MDGKRRKSSRINTQDDYDATGKGGSDNATVRPASTDDTSSASIAVKLSHGDLYQPDLNHADSKSLITRRFKAED